ncbi:MAG: RNA methyltransferase [bacterium]
MASRIYLGLIHYPVRDRQGSLVTTSITNFDLHDIARTARTFGVAKYYLVNPLESQLMLADRITYYWQQGLGSRIVPDRKEAFTVVRVKETLESVVQEIEAVEGIKPILVGTDANELPNSISYTDFRKKIQTGTNPVLLIFGTGWGIEAEYIKTFDYILEPIRGISDTYNHLSVRSAVAIILDRLLSER